MSVLGGREEFDGVLALVAREAARYLAEVDELPVRHEGAEDAARSFGGPLPEEGDGAVEALPDSLVEQVRPLLEAGQRRWGIGWFGHRILSGNV